MCVGGIQLDVVPSKRDGSPALPFELKLIFGDRGERQGWLEPARFAAPFLAPWRQLAGVWACWVGAVPLQTPR